MKTTHRKTSVASVLATSLLLTATVASAQKSGGTRGDGFDMVGDFPNSDVQIKVPEISEADLISKVDELRKTLPDPNAKYEDYINPADQAVFDAVQANIMARLDMVDDHMYNFKQAYVQGVVVYDHFNHDNPGGDEKTHLRQLAGAARPYHDYLRGEYDAILAALDPRSTYNGSGNQTLQWFYHLNAGHQVDTMVEPVRNNATISYHVLFGTSDFSSCKTPVTPGYYNGQINIDRQALANCGWRSVELKSLVEMSRECKDVPCVLEIQKVALELGDASLSLFNKIDLEHPRGNTPHLFYDPKSNMLRRAFSTYIDRKITNHEHMALTAALAGLTNIAYIALVAPVDFVMDLREVGTTFNFMPTYWANKDDRKAVTTLLPDTFSHISDSILPGSIKPRN